MKEWLVESGNLIEIEGLRDRETDTLLDNLSGVTIVASVLDVDELVVGGPFTFAHVTAGDWQAVAPEASVPVVVGERYTLKVRATGPGLASRTWWVPLRIVRGDEDDL